MVLFLLNVHYHIFCIVFVIVLITGGSSDRFPVLGL